MSELLDISLKLDIKENEKLEETIKTVIEDNQTLFQELFEAIIDIDNSQTIVLDGSLVIKEVILVSPTEGIAHGVFDDHLYLGCEGVSASDDHAVSLSFNINNSSINFNIEIPEPWKPM